MKRCLNDEKEEMKSFNRKAILDYSLYIEACEKIAEAIKEKYDLKKEKIGLLGIARGALPMLATLSHLLGIRDVSTIQLQMSNSDDCHDYGKVRVVSENILKGYDKFIVLEDIIYKGLSSSEVVNLLNEKNLKVLDIYTLIIDKGFLKIPFLYPNVDINYVYTLNENDWVYFFWETDVRNIKD